MEPWQTAIVSGLIAVLGVALAGWLQSRRERGASNRATRTPQPPTTQEVWQRLDKKERLLRAAIYVLDEVAEQWPQGAQKPRLSARYAGALLDEGILPPEFDPAKEDTHDHQRPHA